MLDAFEYWRASARRHRPRLRPRPVAILAGIPDGNIREVIAFPKTSGGSDC
jgi:hypothetical protein